MTKNLRLKKPNIKQINSDWQPINNLFENIIHRVTVAHLEKPSEYIGQKLEEGLSSIQNINKTFSK